MRVRVISASAAATLLSSMAGAATTMYYHAGNWHAFSGTDPQHQLICGIGTENTTDGRKLELTYVIGLNALRITASKPNWSIPEDTQVPVVMTVGGHQPWNVQATGHGTSLSWTLQPDGIRAFDPQFRNSGTLVLNFPGGNEPAWTVSLSGSNAVDNTFSRCIADLTQRIEAQAQSAKPTQPYGERSTQPFTPAAPATAPTQPTNPMPTPATPTQPPKSP
jgi:hypothetical protein